MSAPTTGKGPRGTPAQWEARYWGCFRADVGDEAPYAAFLFASDAREWADRQPVRYTIRPIRMSF